MDRIRVIVADDHPLFLDGVVGALTAAEDVDHAKDGPGALQLAREQLPDVAMLDVNMPGGGLQAARDIAAACPATRILMLTVSEDEDDILAAMKAGASGYALKGIPARELVNVVRSVAAGDVYVAPGLAPSTSSPPANGKCWSWSRPGSATLRSGRVSGWPRRRSSTT